MILGSGIAATDSGRHYLGGVGMSQLKGDLLGFGLMASILALLTVTKLGAWDPRPQQGNWDNLKVLVGGQQVKVLLRNRKWVKGNVRGLSDRSLTVLSRDKPVVIARQDVLQVYRIEPKPLTGTTGFLANECSAVELPLCMIMDPMLIKEAIHRSKMKTLIFDASAAPIPLPPK